MEGRHKIMDFRPVFHQGGDGDPVRCFMEDGREVEVIIHKSVGIDNTLGDTVRIVGIAYVDEHPGHRVARTAARASLGRGISRYRDIGPSFFAR
jgi:hypothetical protein